MFQRSFKPSSLLSFVLNIFSINKAHSPPDLNQETKPDTNRTRFLIIKQGCLITMPGQPCLFINYSVGKLF